MQNRTGGRALKEPQDLHRVIISGYQIGVQAQSEGQIYSCRQDESNKLKFKISV
jgi:hypothetical protein